MLLFYKKATKKLLCECIGAGLWDWMRGRKSERGTAMRARLDQAVVGNYYSLAVWRGRFGARMNLGVALRHGV